MKIVDVGTAGLRDLETEDFDANVQARLAST